MENDIENDLGMSTERLAENIREIVCRVDNHIIGRLANKAGDVELDTVDVLLDFVARAGGGNHLEIGTLFGGSAIAVALLKITLAQTGMVVCVDPLNGYYEGQDLSGELVVPKTLFSNIEMFGVGDRVLVMRAYSNACRHLDMEFSTAYIDGGHRNGVPLQDWLCIKDMVTRYVVFDNWEDYYSDVKIACDVASRDLEWECVYNIDTTYIVERVT